MSQNETILLVVGILLFMGIQLLTSILIYRGSKEKGFSPIPWVLLNFILPLIGMLIYYVVNYDRPQATPPKKIDAPTEKIGQNGLQGGNDSCDKKKRDDITVAFNRDNQQKEICLLFINEGYDKKDSPYKIEKKQTVIGRTGGDDGQDIKYIKFDDLSVSRHHLTIFKKESGYSIMHFGENTITKVNGEIVEEGKKIKSGDIIDLGKVVCEFLIR
ncbi:MAG: FHA domain-containing protein [Nitrospirae bacterium]|nr:FHA domain-containing protein [Nitrospirota bacterium]